MPTAGPPTSPITCPRVHDHLVRELEPRLREAGVHPVVNSHSHPWNCLSDRGMPLLGTSNIGNTFGAFHRRSGRSRMILPTPCDPWISLRKGTRTGSSPSRRASAPRPIPSGTRFRSSRMSTGTCSLSSTPATARFPAMPWTSKQPGRVLSSSIASSAGSDLPSAAMGITVSAQALTHRSPRGYNGGRPHVL